MKKQPQSYNGCVLTTIAMLADISLVEAEQYAKAAAKDMRLAWRGSWWALFGYLERDNAANLARGTAERAGLMNFTPVTRVSETVSGVTLAPPDLSGKGQISVELPTGGHSMAYANGFVYDSDFLPVDKETWKEYSARQGDCISKIIVTPYKE